MKNWKGEDRMKKIAYVIMVFAIMLLLTACGESQYDKDLNSGFSKFKSGDIGSMSDGERDAVNDFLEWAGDN